MALYYSDVLNGAPPVLEQHVTRFPVLHSVNVILTVRFVPVPEVLDYERFLVKQLPVPGFFHVVARPVSLLHSPGALAISPVRLPGGCQADRLFSLL